MQTFLPYPDFQRSAQVLDRQRLGKQRVEAWQILKALLGISKGWVNHSACKMWRGHEVALMEYAFAMCDEWRFARGYKDTMTDRISEMVTSYDLTQCDDPPWLGDEAFHLSHRSNLTRKLPGHYSRFWDVPSDLPYVWPEAKR